MPRTRNTSRTSTTTRARRTARSATAANPLRFDRKLVLNQFMFSLFAFKNLEELARGMKDQEWEGLDEKNISRFYHCLAGRLPGEAKLSKELLRQYDENIVRHTLAIQGKREPPVTWKYFQYLSLLFAEIYLDRYFSDTEQLRADLNAHVERFNNGKLEGDQVKLYQAEDLTKMAFWNATGSGKTLLMHVNILQYRHYLKIAGRARELNRIILHTPNEGLSLQHLEEFKLSGLAARIFKKENTSKSARLVYAVSLFPEETPGGQEIEIINIHKLKDEMGEKTVAVDSFEGNNLVLVDEGHRGSSGEEWKAKRDKLCVGGFSFEYSATFGQAIKKSKLVQEYARCIIFDYSYKYFYRDGYGKKYKILNLADDRNDDVRRLFLTACLLAFYQQLKLFTYKRFEFTPFLLEKPLLVFVGGSVNAVRTENRRKVSDVVDILLFINDFIKEEDKSLSFIQRLLGGRPQLLDEEKKEVFAGAFTYLHSLDLNGEQVYRDILKVAFNCPVPGAVLHVERFKNGEIGLRVGDNDYFGVINVGDDAELLKLCAANGSSTGAKEISDSLFQQLNDRHSLVNVLIGSKKFSEGWNSWRVSTMGLMNIGRTEGSEIIQLFGRGVRLKGYDYSLKRSSALFGDDAPEYLNKVETLNIFGIRADYMRQFKEYLEEEGLPKDDDWQEFVLPVVKLPADRRLKVIKIRDDADFKKKGPRPVLALPDERLLK